MNPATAGGNEQLLLRAPPDLPEAEAHGGAAMTALPMLGSLGSMAVLLSMSSTSTAGGRTRALLAGGVFLLTTLILVAVQLDRASRQRRNRIAHARLSYLEHLDHIRAEVRRAAEKQRRQKPAPLTIRVGQCVAPLDVALVANAGGARADPVCVDAAQRLVQVQQRQPGLPLTMDLLRERRISLIGDLPRNRAVARALVCGAARQYDNLRVSVLAADNLRVEWDWLKWLPQASNLGQAADSRVVGHHLVLLDGGIPPTAVTVSMTVIDVCGPLDRTSGSTFDCTPSPERQPAELTIAEAEAIARRLRGGRPARAPATGRGTDLITLLGLNPRDLKPPSSSHRASSQAPLRSAFLRTPLGTTEAGEPVWLDLKESAAGGMGPHGLVVGATGSGKSELLRTLVVGLALTHPAEQLNLVLVDFKGGATFAGLAQLPHVSALVTNLSTETVLVDRMQDALEGELVRRQEVLRRAGGFASLQEYAAAREAGHQFRDQPLEPLPSLLIVIDEFAELLNAKPEFLETFLAIGRLGRSLGIHLLLASQRLEEGRLRGLEAHLSYRIGLRTFSEAESRAVLGSPEAAHLPGVPGAGFLRQGPTDLVRFTASYVSGPMPEPPAPSTRPLLRPFLFGQFDRQTQHELPTQRDQSPDRSPAGPSLLELTVAAQSERERPAHRIWLPPLRAPVTLGQLLPDLVATSESGLHSPTWLQHRSRIPLGLVDQPREQRRDVLAVDLSGSGGHFVAVGAARTGKTTLLQTFAIAVALLNTPRQARLYVVDPSGGLSDLAGLPQLSGLAGPQDPDRLSRILAEVTQLVNERESTGASGEQVFLFIDGWDRLMPTRPELAAIIHDLGVRGLAVNVHLVVSTSRWADLRMATRELFGSRVELRQGDPLDSEIARRAASTVPTGQPGRGLVEGPLHILTALPRLDPTLPAETGLAAVVRRIAAEWPGARAPALRLLPDLVPLEVLPRSDEVRLGLREDDLSVVAFDLDREPHLLIFGDIGSGKSAALRTLGHEITRLHSPKQAQLVVVDYRRALLGEFGADQLLHYASTPDQARDQVAELGTYLTTRLPPHGLDAQQLRDRSWWSGPEVFVLVDDYDLVASGGSPLAPMLPLLAQAADVGLHLILARRTAGASRALYEPAIQTLRDLGSTGLVLSGSAEEGPLIGGVRATALPPGRARLVTRDRGVETCQLAWKESTG